VFKASVVFSSSLLYGLGDLTIPDREAQLSSPSSFVSIGKLILEFSTCALQPRIFHPILPIIGARGSVVG
jgi:hypothetical protein